MVKRNALSRLKKYKPYKNAVLLIAAVLFIVSCRSLPPKAELESSVQLLPEGSDVIIRADIQNNRELIEPVLTGLSGDMPEKLSKDFLDRTATVWAGLDFDADGPEGNAFSSSIAARGDYPKSFLDFGLFWDPGWKKRYFIPATEDSVKMPYWNEKKGPNQLAVPADDLILASSGGIGEMLSAWADPPESAVSREWLESENTADVTIMTRNLSPEDYAKFVPELKKLPLQSMILSLVRIEDEYLISGIFHMDSAVNAFLFSTLFRALVVSAKTEDGERRFVNLKEIKIDKDGNDVILNGMKISVSEAAEIETKWIGSAGFLKVE